MFDRRNNLSDLVAADARSFFGDRVYDTMIPRNIRISEAPSHGKPVLIYDNSSAGALAYGRACVGDAGPSSRRAWHVSGNPRLGRGLAALMGDAAAAGGPASRSSLSDRALEPGPFQPRTIFHAERWPSWSHSIRRQGMLQPLLARPHPEQAGRFQIIAGERRWRAAQVAGLHDSAGAAA